MSPVSWLYGIGISVALTLAVVWIAKAFFRITEQEGASSARSAPVQALLDERDRLLLNLRELDFDFQLKKVSDEDRDALRRQLRDDLTVVLSKIEGHGVEPDAAAGTEEVE